MAKNIVLCSDGTGNRGGKGQGTNVWRLYHAIDRNSGLKDQITFYDDGVGTEDNKYIRLIFGAFGIGLSRNVLDLYRFLVLNFKDKEQNATDNPENTDEEDDYIYLFGFSRGAYTVRALAAFVTSCGVIKDARNMSEQQLKTKTQELVARYKSRWTGETSFAVQDVAVTYPNIKCIGVWDTVSAVGLPFDITLQKKLLRFVFPFLFKDSNLNNKTEHAFHAISIDDQRLTFRPEIWNERKEGGIKQVWFAGVHSNVGGGYPKQGMSHITLDWMMEKVDVTSGRGWGLNFNSALRDAARHEAHVHDKLYDSRAGVAAYYRYTPRDIDELTPKGDTETPVRIHDSVFDRIEAKTLAYNPGNLPDREITVTPTRGAANPKRQARVNEDERRKRRGKTRHEAQQFINARKALHLAFVLLSLLVATVVAQYTIETASDWRYLPPGLFVLVTIVVLLEIREPYCWAVSVLALVISTAFWIPLFSGIPLQKVFGGPIEVWQWLKGLLQLLPDVVSKPAIDFISAVPFAAAAIVIAFAIIMILRRVFVSKLADIHEEVCNTVR